MTTVVTVTIEETGREGPYHTTSTVQRSCVRDNALFRGLQGLLEACTDPAEAISWLQRTQQQPTETEPSQEQDESGQR